ncbi:hypothetical protein F5Y17DRAFT_349406 [Xylariaceae sp. FL0594]|nr:hypothetical protein F5Y17DRAFT_349406 [Xylariaceae sp. FL0594]
MRPQNEITQPEPLHNKEDGSLLNPGFSRRPYQVYDRSLVRAWPRCLRLKEWDYYLVSDGACALCLTIADLGYSGLYSVSLIDFGTSSSSSGLRDLLLGTRDGRKGFAAPEGSRASSKTASAIRFFPLGRTDLPTTSTEGVSCYEGGGMRLRFTVSKSSSRSASTSKTGEKTERRRLEVFVKDFVNGAPLSADIVLTDEPRDSMVIATPFGPRHRGSFFYNRKIVGMRAKGSFTLGGTTHIFDPDPHALTPGPALGLLDWGRGVWTRDNTWYWAAAHGYHHNHTTADGQMQKKIIIGFNLGYGFGDTSAATENMFFVDGVAHKLGDVDFGIPDDDDNSPGKEPSYLKQWRFTSKDEDEDEKRLDMVFDPIVDRTDYINHANLVVSDQHQVMGRCKGRVVLDDGAVLEFENLLATAEKIRNKW